nr:Fe-only nitrogenase accessory AnfO family protein [uncultured Caproiciproducens sp.]
MDKIAVIMNDKNKINSIQEDAIICVFEKQDAVWTVVKNIPINIDYSQELSALREELNQLVEELGDCKIIVGKMVPGLTYHIFDKMGFDIFEVESFHSAILDQILSDVQNKSDQTETGSSSAEPVETDVPGVYHLDLIALQNQNPEISSKMALQPFLNSTPFIRLDLVCAHLPPWLEKLADEKKLNLKTERLAQGKTRVSITRISCEQEVRF